MMNRWIGNAVGLMHLHKITQKDIASYLGVTNEYVSMILNGKKNPKNIEERFFNAINAIIQSKKGW